MDIRDEVINTYQEYAGMLSVHILTGYIVKIYTGLYDTHFIRELEIGSNSKICNRMIGNT